MRSISLADTKILSFAYRLSQQSRKHKLYDRLKLTRVRAEKSYRAMLSETKIAYVRTSSVDNDYQIICIINLEYCIS